jgi:hypothetical protein
MRDDRVAPFALIRATDPVNAGEFFEPFAERMPP